MVSWCFWRFLSGEFFFESCEGSEQDRMDNSIIWVGRGRGQQPHYQIIRWEVQAKKEKPRCTCLLQVGNGPVSRSVVHDATAALVSATGHALASHTTPHPTRKPQPREKTEENPRSGSILGTFRYSGSSVLGPILWVVPHRNFLTQ